MGYTHYWRFVKNNRDVRGAYKRALIDCAKIVQASPVLLAGGDGTGVPDLCGRVFINGVEDNAHETFDLPEKVPDVKGERCPGVPNGLDFCKTARKPYDVVVVACLCVLQDALKGAVRVSSDGGSAEWAAGQTLACRVLGREIPIPDAVRAGAFS